MVVQLAATRPAKEFNSWPNIVGFLPFPSVTIFCFPPSPPPKTLARATVGILRLPNSSTKRPWHHPRISRDTVALRNTSPPVSGPDVFYCFSLPCITSVPFLPLFDTPLRSIQCDVNTYIPSDTNQPPPLYAHPDIPDSSQTYALLIRSLPGVPNRRTPHGRSSLGAPGSPFHPVPIPHVRRLRWAITRPPSHG